LSTFKSTSGIGLFPNLASIGTGLGTVSGAVPPNGTSVAWYKFYPCVARDGGGDAKAELLVPLPGSKVIAPIDVDMR